MAPADPPRRGSARPRPQPAAVGERRRLDHGTSPDRLARAVAFPDERRPRSRPPGQAPLDRRPPRGPSGPAAAPPAGPARRPGPQTRAAAAASVRRHPGVEAGREPGRWWEPGDAGRAGPATRTSAAPPGRRRRRTGVEANARLTAMTAAVLLVLLAVEGLTILRIGPLLGVHVFVGMLIIPPVLVKIGSTTWRFARYYLGDPEYRRKGPPPPLLRMLGPVMVVLTVAVLVSGVALLLAPASSRGPLLTIHQASFVLWFLAMVVHVLGHLLDTAKLAPRDFVQRTGRQIRGARGRQWLVASSLVLGLILGAVLVPRAGAWLVAPLHP